MPAVPRWKTRAIKATRLSIPRLEGALRIMEDAVASVEAAYDQGRFTAAEVEGYLATLDFLKRDLAKRLCLGSPKQKCEKS